MKRIMVAATLIVWLFVSVGAVHATNYYVSNIGSDSAVGSDSSAPWATLGKVNGFPFAPGDNIYFRRGDTWIGCLNISHSGTTSQPITYSAYGSGQKPIISNSGQWSRSVVITASWTIVDGLLLRDSMEAGVLIASGSTYNIVRNCEMTAVGEGVQVEGNNNLITGNVIHDTTMIVNTPTPTNDDYGANGVVITNGLNNEVSYNTIYNCIAKSYDYGMDGGAFELYGTTDGTYFHHNYAYENNGFLEAGASTAGNTANNVIVAYNISRDNFHGNFMTLHNSGTFSVNITNLRIENNTIIETKYTAGWIFSSDVSPQSGMLSFTNNIVYLTAGNFSKYSFTRSNNLYYPLPTKFAGGLQAGETVGDPLFINLQAYDYHLQDGSPAIYAGLVLGYSKDFDGNSVPFGPQPDLGVYEWTKGSKPRNIRITN